MAVLCGMPTIQYSARPPEALSCLCVSCLLCAFEAS